MIATSNRLTNFKYAIRNIVGAAEELELSGRPVTYLNIGDPQIFGFRPPPHVIEAVQRALSDSFTGYAHSTGLFEARASIAAYATGLGVPTNPEYGIVQSGPLEGGMTGFSWVVYVG